MTDHTPTPDAARPTREVLDRVCRDVCPCGGDGHNPVLSPDCDWALRLTHAVLSHPEVVAARESTPAATESRDYGTPSHPRHPSPERVEVDRVANLLIDTWNRVESKPVHVAYVATFADMARAVIADRTAPASEVAATEDDERVEIACAWSDYRKDYGASGAQEHKAFVAGWEAARGTLDAGGPQR